MPLPLTQPVNLLVDRQSTPWKDFHAAIPDGVSFFCALRIPTPYLFVFNVPARGAERLIPERFVDSLSGRISNDKVLMTND
jgi:hypothetical protein